MWIISRNSKTEFLLEAYYKEQGLLMDSNVNVGNSRVFREPSELNAQRYDVIEYPDTAGKKESKGFCDSISQAFKAVYEAPTCVKVMGALGVLCLAGSAISAYTAFTAMQTKCKLMDAPKPTNSSATTPSTTVNQPEFKDIFPKLPVVILTSQKTNIEVRESFGNHTNRCMVNSKLIGGSSERCRTAFTGQPVDVGCRQSKFDLRADITDSAKMNCELSEMGIKGVYSKKFSLYETCKIYDSTGVNTEANTGVRCINLPKTPAEARDALFELGKEIGERLKASPNFKYDNMTEGALAYEQIQEMANAYDEYGIDFNLGHSLKGGFFKAMRGDDLPFIQEHTVLPVNVTSSESPANVTSTELPENVTSGQSPINVTSTGSPINVTSDELPINVTSTELPMNVTSTELPENVTSTVLPENVTTSGLTTAVTTDGLTTAAATGELTTNATSTGSPKVNVCTTMVDGVKHSTSTNAACGLGALGFVLMCGSLLSADFKESGVTVKVGVPKDNKDMMLLSYNGVNHYYDMREVTFSSNLNYDLVTLVKFLVDKGEDVGEAYELALEICDKVDMRTGTTDHGDKAMNSVRCFLRENHEQKFTKYLIAMGIEDPENKTGGCWLSSIFSWGSTPKTHSPVPQAARAVAEETDEPIYAGIPLSFIRKSRTEEEQPAEPSTPRAQIRAEIVGTEDRYSTGSMISMEDLDLEFDDLSNDFGQSFGSLTDGTYRKYS